jgi:hypothetical protein
MSPASADDESNSGLRARVASLVRRITPNCRDITRLASERLEHPLPLGARLRFGLHLSVCVYCARYVEQLELLDGALRSLKGRLDDLPQLALGARGRARLKQALRERDSDHTQR